MFNFHHCGNIQVTEIPTLKREFYVCKNKNSHYFDSQVLTNCEGGTTTVIVNCSFSSIFLARPFRKGNCREKACLYSWLKKMWNNKEKINFYINETFTFYKRAQLGRLKRKCCRKCAWQRPISTGSCMWCTHRRRGLAIGRQFAQKHFQAVELQLWCAETWKSCSGLCCRLN